MSEALVRRKGKTLTNMGTHNSDLILLLREVESLKRMVDGLTEELVDKNKELLKKESEIMKVKEQYKIREEEIRERVNKEWEHRFEMLQSKEDGLVELEKSLRETKASKGLNPLSAPKKKDEVKARDVVPQKKEVKMRWK